MARILARLYHLVFLWQCLSLPILLWLTVSSCPQSTFLLFSRGLFGQPPECCQLSAVDQCSATERLSTLARATPLISSLATSAPVTMPLVRQVLFSKECGATRHESARPRLIPSNLQQVALLLPLSGHAAHIGQALLNGAQIALFEAASAALVLQVYNTQGTPDGAAHAANIARAQGVPLIIGPLFSSEVRAVEQAVQSSDVKMLTFTSEKVMAGNSVFSIGPHVGYQIERVVTFAREKGFTLFAALAPDNAYGRQAVMALHTAVTAADGHITAVEFYDPQNANLTPVVRRLAQQQPFEALLIPDRSEIVRRVFQILLYLDIDMHKTRILSTQRWTDNLYCDAGVAGTWYAAPTSPAQAWFSTHYRQVFGDMSPLPFAKLSYDAVALAAVLTRGTTRPFHLNSRLITSETGFSGVDGLFRLRLSGEAERGLAVIEVQVDGMNSVISPPQDFFKRR